MDSDSLIAGLKKDELAVEETALVAWEICAVQDMDGVAQFLYRGGSYRPQASLETPSRLPRPEDDRRPEKKYWDYVKAEMAVFLCEDAKRYRELWKRLGGLENKSATAIVGVIAAYFGERAGVPATLLGGFVAVVLYGAAKLGKEALCRYLDKRDA
jgi:hypothetical protein